MWQTHRHRHTDTQTHRRRYTDTQTHRHTETQTHRHGHTDTQTQTHRHTDTQIHKHTGTQTHRHIDTQTQTHRHTQTHTHIHIHILDYIPCSRVVKGVSLARSVRLWFKIQGSRFKVQGSRFGYSWTTFWFPNQKWQTVGSLRLVQLVSQGLTLAEIGKNIPFINFSVRLLNSKTRQINSFPRNRYSCLYIEKPRQGVSCSKNYCWGLELDKYPRTKWYHCTMC